MQLQNIICPAWSSMPLRSLSMWSFNVLQQSAPLQHVAEKIGCGDITPHPVFVRRLRQALLDCKMKHSTFYAECFHPSIQILRKNEKAALLNWICIPSLPFSTTWHCCSVWFPKSYLWTVSVQTHHQYHPWITTMMLSEALPRAGRASTYKRSTANSSATFAGPGGNGMK